MIRPLILFAIVAAPLTLAATSRTPPKARPSVRADWVHVVVVTPEGGGRMGNPNAPVKIIEYGSRTCPHCAKFDAEGRPEFEAKYIATGKVSYEFRDYPVHGALDLAPIILGRCVRPPQFFPVLSAMFREQAAMLANADATIAAVRAQPGASPNHVTTTFAEGLGYLAFMKRQGFAEAPLRRCLNDKAALEKVASQTKLADERYGVTGTPTFIVNGKQVPNVYDWAGLRNFLETRPV